MSYRHGALTTADILISLFIIFPLSVLHWRGTWGLQDVYFYPSNDSKSWWLSFAIGGNVCVVELLLQPLLIEFLSPDRRILYVIVTRLHLYIHGWAVMCYWRGLWNLCDLYLSTNWLNSIIVYAICQLTMIVTKTVRTAVGIPVALRLDTSPDLLEPDIVFKTPPQHIFSFVFDCLFTQFVIVSSSICIWRGLWNILDAFIFPHRHFRSDVVSLIVGFSLTSVFLLCYYPLSRVSRSLDHRPAIKLVFEDAIFLVLTWSNLFLWRGGWNLCISHFLPPTGPHGPAVGAWVSHAIGTVGLMAFQVFSNVGLHGIDRDGSYNSGEGIYPLHYLHEVLPKSWLLRWANERPQCDDESLENSSSTSKDDHSSPQSPDSTRLLPSNHLRTSDIGPCSSSDDEEYELLSKLGCGNNGGSGTIMTGKSITSGYSRLPIRGTGSMNDDSHGIKQYKENVVALLSEIGGKSTEIPASPPDMKPAS